MSQATDLTFIPTQELITEMAKRHDGLVIAGIKFNTNSAFVLTKYWGGNHFVCLGMIEDMKHQINRQGERSFTPDK